MAPWWAISVHLCGYGFVKELRPSEPFITPFLISPWHNLTVEEVTQDIYPVSTYSYLAVLIFVFLLTDFLRYKPVIVLEGIAYVITYSLLLWANGLVAMQIVEFFYALASSTEIAYYTYIYAKVDPQYYQKVTSHTYTAVLVGRFVSMVFAQTSISSGWLNYWDLNAVTFSCEIVAFLIASTLPGVSYSIYFHRKESSSPAVAVESGYIRTVKLHLHRVCTYLWSDFKAAYSNLYVVKWSLWWAISTCGFLQVGNYIQPLWEEISENNENAEAYNGAIDAIHTLISAIVTFGVGYLRINWVIVGEWVITVIAVISGVLLATAGYMNNLYVSYVNYIIFRVLYQLTLTVASAQVAMNIKQDSHGLVFGVNTFLALLIESVLTVVVVTILGLAPTTQFIIYGMYFLVVAAIFSASAIYNTWKGPCSPLCLEQSNAGAGAGNTDSVQLDDNTSFHDEPL